MANLAAQKDLPAKDAGKLSLPMGVISAFRGGALGYVKGTGYMVKVDNSTTPPIRFAGVATETVDNSAGSAGDKRIVVQTTGLIGFDSSGLTIADVGKVVYFSDDHTVSTTVAKVAAGRLVQIDSDGRAYVDITGFAGQGLRLRTVTMQVPAAATGTTRARGYFVPVGAHAFVVSGKYDYTVKPSLQTSALLDVSKVSGTTRTSLLAATVDVDDTTPAVDTLTALSLSATASVLALAAGDRVEASITTVGTLTAAGDTAVYLEILETGGGD